MTNSAYIHPRSDESNIDYAVRSIPAVVAIGMAVLFGTWLRFGGLDWGHGFFMHPDELKLIVESISKLSQICSRWVESGGRILQQPTKDTMLQLRFGHYYMLSILLLGHSININRLRKMSPYQLLQEILLPLANWYDQYYTNVAEQISFSADAIASDCAWFREVSQESLLTSTDEILFRARKFIDGLVGFLKVVA